MVAVQAPAFLRRLGPAAEPGRVGGSHVALIAFIPIAVFTLTRHAQVFVERILGSELSAGTISHLNYAQKVAQVPMVLSIMVATVMPYGAAADGEDGPHRALGPGTPERTTATVRPDHGPAEVDMLY
jgi:putative peptidoglycan lipid II flippase